MLNKHRRNVYAINDTLTEKEFLSRELNLEIKKSHDLLADCLNEITLYGECFIATPNSLNIANDLTNLPDSSVIIFLLGNETYEPDIFNCLNNKRSVKWVFIYNLPTRIKRSSSIYSLIGDILDSGIKNLFGEQSSFRDFLISNTLKRKFKNISINYPHSSFPQGYSNNFVYQLMDLNIINKEESLYESQNLAKLRESSTRSNFLNFIGQLTNRRRLNTIAMARSIPNSVVKTVEGFSGVNYTDNYYVKTQINSKYCLVPPGFFNNQNHRYSESLILGSVPLILSHNSIDPSENSNWTKKLNVIRAHSFKYLFKFALKVSEHQRKEIIASELTSEKNELLKIRITLNSLLIKNFS
jgi:hypothetical protein